MSNKSTSHDLKSISTAKKSVVLTYLRGPGYIASREMARRRYARNTESKDLKND